MSVTEKELNDIWRDYQDGKAYQDAVGLTVNLPKFVKFYEGEQWPKATAATKDLPRATVNIIKMICRNKKAAICSGRVRITYRAENENAGCEEFNRFAEYMQREIGQERVDGAAVADGLIKGTYVYHYYWDAEAKGKRGNYDGALRVELIEPLNVIFANPHEVDEQKQKWIIIATREDVDGVKAKADADVNANLIVADENDDKYNSQEPQNGKRVTVVTRYFRRGGEVYCEKAVRGTVVNKAFPIAPQVDSAKAAMGIDEPNNALPDREEDGKTLTDRKVRAPLYPIVVGQYEKKEGSIYGLSEVEGLIPNQRLINFIYSMMALNVQNNAWSKYIVTENALQGQMINNTPGQILIDHTGTGNGIRRMTEYQMNTFPLQFIDSLTSITRVISGASEVMTGETVGANMSGAAIAQLQAQALAPIEDLRNNFWLVKEKQGKVLAQFYKLNYFDAEYVYELNGQLQKGIYSSAPFADINFEVSVETTSGTRASVAGDITMLDSLLARGVIDAETYIDLYPDAAITNKRQIKDALRARRAPIEAQLQAELTQAQAQLKAQEKLIADVDTILRENRQVKEMLAQVVAEANRKIDRAQSALEDATADATAFANEYVHRKDSGYGRGFNENVLPDMQNGGAVPQEGLEDSVLLQKPAVQRAGEDLL